VPVLLIALGYLCGSIPFGLLLARRAGVDVRRVGSGNIGAANVARSASVRLGIATLALDAAKGALPVALARWLANDPVAAGAGLAAFLGHVFPLYLGLAGGKGVATALGVLATLCPAVASTALVVFVAVFAVWRYVSAASIAAALSTPVAAWVLAYPEASVATILAMTVVIVVRHRQNLARLRAGTEPRFVLKKQATPSN
jgi:acyl phosphate:glycerol-3-phosphate acyltransferase